MVTNTGTIPSALLAPISSQSSPNVKIPKLIYGTAWKKERTSDLVYQAITAGFKGIDTAAQPRHYQEDLVGKGIGRAISEGLITREQLYIQTKFTPLSGQDRSNLPYTPTDPLPTRIHTSLASSLSNFTFSDPEPYIDCLVLHSPLPTVEETLEAWKTFEAYVPSQIRSLGLSNTPLPVLEALWDDMTIKPSVIQNRFYPGTEWEVPLRGFCCENGIAFQSFWTLTGNPQLMGSDVVAEFAGELEKIGIDEANPLALYALVLGLEGISVLNGTTRRERMMHDLESLEVVGKLVEGEWMEKWESWVHEFKNLIGKG